MQFSSLEVGLPTFPSLHNETDHLFGILDYQQDPPNTIYVALDLHKDNVVMSVGTTSDDITCGPRFEELCLKKIRTLGKDNVEKFADILASFVEGKPHRIVCESTYNWYWLANLCERRGWRFCLCDPSTVSQAKNKYADDFTDASYLCKRFWMRELHIVQVGYHQDRAIRDLIRTRQEYVQARARLKTTICNKLTNHLSEAYNYDGLIKNNNLGELTGDDLLAALTNILGDELLAESILMIIEQIRLISDQIQRCERRFISLVKQKPELAKAMDLIQSIDGAGPVLSAIIATEIIDIARFSTVKQLISYCRLAPTTKLSNGKQVTPRMEMHI